MSVNVSPDSGVGAASPTVRDEAVGTENVTPNVLVRAVSRLAMVRDAYDRSPDSFPRDSSTDSVSPETRQFRAIRSPMSSSQVAINVRDLEQEDENEPGAPPQGCCQKMVNGAKAVYQKVDDFLNAHPSLRKGLAGFVGGALGTTFTWAAIYQGSCSR